MISLGNFYMYKRFVMAFAAATVLLAAQPAAASHIFFYNVKLDGVALDSTSGVTNPTFNVGVGQSLTFTADAFGNPDTLNVTLSGAPVTNPLLLIAFGGGGPMPISGGFIFNVAGNYMANLFIDFPTSDPDYFTPNFSEQNGATLPFNVNVAGVPEPGVWAMMLMGFFGTGVMVRSRRSRETRATA